MRVIGVLVALMFLMISIASPVEVFAGGDVMRASCTETDEHGNARNITGPGGEIPAACVDRGDETPNDSLFGPEGVLTKAATLISIVVGIASVIMIIIGGFKYVLASGDPNNIKSAKDTIMYAIVGLAVASLSQFIVLFVLARL